MPTRFLRVQVAEVGFGVASGGMLGEIRALSLAYCTGRFDFGISGFELGQATLQMGDFGATFLALAPLRCRFNLVENRVRTAFLYNSVPALYSEATVSALNMDLSGVHPRLVPQVYGRLSLGSEVGYYGLGIGLEAGVVAGHTFEPGPSAVGAYAQLSLRALTGSFSLTGIPRDY